MSIGSIINRLCDSFLPDSVGDAIGAAADAVAGNPVGVVQNVIDLVEDVAEAARAEKIARLRDICLGLCDSLQPGGVIGSLLDGAGRDGLVSGTETSVENPIAALLGQLRA